MHKHSYDTVVLNSYPLVPDGHEPLTVKQFVKHVMELHSTSSFCKEFEVCEIFREGVKHCFYSCVQAPRLSKLLNVRPHLVSTSWFVETSFGPVLFMCTEGYISGQAGCFGTNYNIAAHFRTKFKRCKYIELETRLVNKRWKTLMVFVQAH